MYSLVVLLVAVMTGMMCGQQGPTAIAQWIEELPFLVRATMGLPLGRSPSAMMLCRLFWRLDPDELETALGEWIKEVNARLARSGGQRRIAVDGKAQRGAAKRGAESAHLLAAASHQIKTVLAQVPVDSKTNEITMVSALLDLLLVEGHLITMDAPLTQREIARDILARKGDYLMVVKENQPQLREDIRICFDAEPLPDESRGTAATINKGHGRLEVREIVTSAALYGHPDYEDLTIERVLRECALCDTHGFLLPAKKASGNTPARSRLSKHSLVEFSFALALPKHQAETIQLATRSGDGKEDGQMLMKMPARSGEYALCIRYKSVGIGVDTNKWIVIVQDEEERLRRHRAILAALRDQLLSPSGALTSRMLPHLTGIMGAVVIRPAVGRAPPLFCPGGRFCRQVDRNGGK